MTNPSSGTGGSERLSEHSRQFLAWVAARPRTYAEAMEAWRTTCPRLSAWEDAMANDLIHIDAGGAAGHGQARVRLTEKGADGLARSAPVHQPATGPR